MTQAVFIVVASFLFAEKLCIKRLFAANRKTGRWKKKGRERENPSRKQKIFHFLWHRFFFKKKVNHSLTLPCLYTTWWWYFKLATGNLMLFSSCFSSHSKSSAISAVFIQSSSIFTQKDVDVNGYFWLKSCWANACNFNLI